MNDKSNIRTYRLDMTFFNNISIKLKIALTAAVGVGGFIIYLLLNLSVTQQNEVKLEAVVNIYYPVLEKANNNLVRLDKLRESFNQAVATSEVDLLEKSQDIAQEIRLAFDEFIKIDPSFELYVANVKELFETYYQNAESVSKSIIDGSIDPTTMSSTISKMQEQQTSVDLALTGFRDAARLQFTNNIQEANKQASNALILGTVTGVIVILLMAGATVLVGAVITKSVNEVNNSLENIGSGSADLTARLEIRGNDEVGTTVNRFNYFIEKLQVIMQGIKRSSDELMSAGSLVVNEVENTSRFVVTQQGETSQVATAITQMASTVHTVAEHAQEASELAKAANQQAQTGRVVVDETIDVMTSLASAIEKAASVVINLEQKSEKIGVVLDVIRGISDQTNLLALNAAIEAARAGDQGRGFAVVADEVRTLASRTHQSTAEIQDVIQQLQAEAEAAVGAMETGRSQAQNSVIQAQKAGESLETIAKTVDKITEMSVQIASATEEQSAVAQEIDQNVVKIAELADQTWHSAAKALESVQHMNKLSAALQQQVGSYKV